MKVNVYNDTQSIDLKFIQNSYEILDWDSNFFAFKVCKIKANNLTDAELEAVLAYLSATEVELIYYSSEREISAKAKKSDYFQIKLVDKKTTLVKNITKNNFENNLIEPYKEKLPDTELIKLAIQSGVYSRFNVDEKIGKQKFEELYSLLLINSLKKEIAQEVLLIRNETEITGFITLGEKNQRADIGLIAVDTNYRGKGMGKLLMQAAEYWFYDKGYNQIQVVTQYDNPPAIFLYKSCGYEIEKIEYFYHCWNNKKIKAYKWNR